MNPSFKKRWLVRTSCFNDEIEKTIAGELDLDKIYGTIYFGEN